MSEPLVTEELGNHQFVVEKPTESQRVEHVQLEYEKRMEKFKNEDLAQVELAIGRDMTEQKRELLLRILNELHENIQKEDAKLEQITPGSAANSTGKRELINKLETLRNALLSQAK